MHLGDISDPNYNNVVCTLRNFSDFSVYIELRLYYILAVLHLMDFNVTIRKKLSQKNEVRVWFFFQFHTSPPCPGPHLFEESYICMCANRN